MNREVIVEKMFEAPYASKYFLHFPFEVNDVVKRNYDDALMKVTEKHQTMDVEANLPYYYYRCTLDSDYYKNNIYFPDEITFVSR